MADNWEYSDSLKVMLRKYNDIVSQVNSLSNSLTQLASSIQSVQSQIGSIGKVIDKRQLGIDRVDNTHDIDKPVSRAVSEQLEDIRSSIASTTIGTDDTGVIVED